MRSLTPTLFKGQVYFKMQNNLMLWWFFAYKSSMKIERQRKQNNNEKVSSDQIRSDQISRSVVSDCLRPHESQHARPPCPSPTPGVHWDSRPSISALLTMPKPLTVWITINWGKFWKRWEYQTTWSASWEICMQVRKQQLKLDMEQQTGSK